MSWQIDTDRWKDSHLSIYLDGQIDGWIDIEDENIDTVRKIDKIFPFIYPSIYLYKKRINRYKLFDNAEKKNNQKGLVGDKKMTLFDGSEIDGQILGYIDRWIDTGINRQMDSY